LDSVDNGGLVPPTIARARRFAILNRIYSQLQILALFDFHVSKGSQ